MYLCKILDKFKSLLKYIHEKFRGGNKTSFENPIRSDNIEIANNESTEQPSSNKNSFKQSGGYYISKNKKYKIGLKK